jgi:G2/mitotic-specific cyclin-B, other
LLSQLVGVTALMLAAKYEEIYPPEVRDYVYICDNAYTREQIVQMEQLILSKLNFRLTVPTQRSYLKRFCKAAQGDARHLMLTSYLMELTLVDAGALAFRPSELCAAATHLALRITGMPPWSPTLVSPPPPLRRPPALSAV